MVLQTHLCGCGAKCKGNVKADVSEIRLITIDEIENIGDSKSENDNNACNEVTEKKVSWQDKLENNSLSVD